ncbi:uncharacterized protein LOC143423715 isoform X1 [Xylocopa sonorina]|uniref:uncharacterized protein LOC143423715 isoform X1 n=1 Tax=Xylocopa sonorina TaxID=1818115 RepID=UPI00403AB9A9
MKLLLQFSLLLTILLITTSEGFFFEYPKKVIKDFLQTLKDKKEAKKGPHVQHYHVHYYPIVHPLAEAPTKAPKKHELDEIHNDYLATLGWFDHEYKFTPEPKIKISSSLYGMWKDSFPWEHKLEADIFETVDHSENEGIYVHVPVNRKITIENPLNDKKLKTTVLSSIFQKLLDTKNSIHP